MARNKKPDDSYNAPFPSALRGLLNDRKETQGDIAAVTGKTRQTVSQYYNGISEPSYDTLVKIADHFDVSLDYLLGRTGEPHRKPSAVDELCLSPKAVENIKIIISSPYKDEIKLVLSPLLESDGFYDVLENILSYTYAIRRNINNSKETNASEGPYCDSAYNIVDRAFSAALAEEINDKYSYTQGNIVVLCGKDAIDFARHNIEHYFSILIEEIFGYKAYSE